VSDAPATEIGRDTSDLDPPLAVEVVCGLGAGDAFGGSLADGLLAGLDPVEIVTRANAAGAIVAGRMACSHAMPTSAEIDQMLGSRK
jgi:5-dehydro-2-deoxygluconokinase